MTTYVVVGAHRIKPRPTGFFCSTAPCTSSHGVAQGHNPSQGIAQLFGQPTAQYRADWGEECPILLHIYLYLCNNFKKNPSWSFGVVNRAIWNLPYNALQHNLLSLFSIFFLCTLKVQSREKERRNEFLWGPKSLAEVCLPCCVRLCLLLSRSMHSSSERGVRPARRRTTTAAACTRFLCCGYWLHMMQERVLRNVVLAIQRVTV